MKVHEHKIRGEDIPRSVQHVIYVSYGTCIYLSGVINNPNYHQTSLRVHIVVPSSIDDTVYQPAASVDVGITLSQVDELITDLQAQRLRMLPKVET